MGKEEEFNSMGTDIPKSFFHSLSPKRTLARQSEEKASKRIVKDKH
jgi:hypothetical protein